MLVCMASSTESRGSLEVGCRRECDIHNTISSLLERARGLTSTHKHGMYMQYVLADTVSTSIIQLASSGQILMPRSLYDSSRYAPVLAVHLTKSYCTPSVNVVVFVCLFICLLLKCKGSNDAKSICQSSLQSTELRLQGRYTNKRSRLTTEASA